MSNIVNNTSYFDGPSKNTQTEIIVVPFRVTSTSLAIFYGLDYYEGTQPYIRLINQDTRRMREGQTYLTQYSIFRTNVTIVFIKDQMNADIRKLTFACLKAAGNTCKSIQLPIFRPDSHPSDCNEGTNVQLMLDGITTFRSENPDNTMEILIRLSEPSVARVVLDTIGIPYLGVWDLKTQKIVKK